MEDIFRIPKKNRYISRQGLDPKYTKKQKQKQKTKAKAQKTPLKKLRILSSSGRGSKRENSDEHEDVFSFRSKLDSVPSSPSLSAKSPSSSNRKLRKSVIADDSSSSEDDNDGHDEAGAGIMDVVERTRRYSNSNGNPQTINTKNSNSNSNSNCNSPMNYTKHARQNSNHTLGSSFRSPSPSKKAGDSHHRSHSSSHSSGHSHSDRNHNQKQKPKQKRNHNHFDLSHNQYASSPHKQTPRPMHDRNHNHNHNHHNDNDNRNGYNNGHAHANHSGNINGRAPLSNTLTHTHNHNHMISPPLALQPPLPVPMRSTMELSRDPNYRFQYNQMSAHGDSNRTKPNDRNRNSVKIISVAERKRLRIENGEHKKKRKRRRTFSGAETSDGFGDDEDGGGREKKEKLPRVCAQTDCDNGLHDDNSGKYCCEICKNIGRQQIRLASVAKQKVEELEKVRIENERRAEHNAHAMEDMRHKFAHDFGALFDNVTPHLTEKGSARNLKYGYKLEKRIFALCQKQAKDFKERCNSVKFNLKKNEELMKQVLSGAISLKALSQMSDKDMASSLLNSVRKQREKVFFAEKMLSKKPVLGKVMEGFQFIGDRTDICGMDDQLQQQSHADQTAAAAAAAAATAAALAVTPAATATANTMENGNETQNENGNGMDARSLERQPLPQRPANAMATSTSVANSNASAAKRTSRWMRTDQSGDSGGTSNGARSATSAAAQHARGNTFHGGAVVKKSTRIQRVISEESEEDDDCKEQPETVTDMVVASAQPPSPSPPALPPPPPPPKRKHKHSSGGGSKKQYYAQFISKTEPSLNNVWKGIVVTQDKKIPDFVISLSFLAGPYVSLKKYIPSSITVSGKSKFAGKSGLNAYLSEFGKPSKSKSTVVAIANCDQENVDQLNAFAQQLTLSFHGRACDMKDSARCKVFLLPYAKSKSESGFDFKKVRKIWKCILPADTKLWALVSIYHKHTKTKKTQKQL